MEKLYHKILGQGDPIIILHGLFGMSDNWLTFAKQLAEKNMVILIDVRNHGRSPHTDTFTYHEAAEDIARFCQENWIYQATILGHSMGGKIAMQLAYDHPELAKKLIVVDIAPINYPARHQIIIETLSQIDIRNAQSRKAIEKQIIKRIHDLSVVRFLMKNLSRTKKEGFRWKMNLPVLSRNYEEILAQSKLEEIDIPTLFIKGEKSDYIESEGRIAIDRIFTNYTIETIKDAGHWVHADQPQLLYNIVTSFLQQIKS